MDGDALRALQAPIKASYREHPEAAQLTLSARGTLVGNALTCRVEATGGLVEAGLHPATGGDGSAACSGAMLLEALVACAGVTLRAVAAAMGIPIRGGSVLAEGDWDARGTLGVDKAAPVGFPRVRLRFEVDSDASDEQLAKLLSLTERYCVVAQTLKNPPELTSEIVPNRPADR
ncbi:OsmC family protein [Tautonia rosea]|uniref:OsmC family protein n=1 Tax=Tautonia rosea TaxID=2728037 RepID=UPI001476520E|nr:OsmC family protein [Tautonia rosea]